MPEIVFQMVTPVFQHIVILVFYLPTSTGTVCKQLHVVFGDGFVGYPTVVVGNFSFFFVPYPEIKVIDQ